MSPYKRFACLLGTAFALVLGRMTVAAPAYAQGDGWTGTMTVVQHTVQPDFNGSRTIDSTITYQIAGADQDPSVDSWSQSITWSAHWTVDINVPPDPPNDPGCVSSFTIDRSGSGTFMLTFVGVGGEYINYVAGATSDFGEQLAVPGCSGRWVMLTANSAETDFQPLPPDPSTLTGTGERTDIPGTTLTTSWNISIDPAVLPLPVVPEAPLALLLPLGAGGLLTAGFVISRRRGRPDAT